MCVPEKTGQHQASAFVQALDASRPASANSWILPVGHFFHSAVQPFCARTNDRLIPIGTAFTLSSLGIVASAYHNVHEALQHHPNGDRLRSQAQLPDGLHLGALRLALIYQHVPRPDVQSVLIQSVETLISGPPADILFGVPTPPNGAPFIAMPLSFSMPRVGSRVSVLGYGALQTGSHGLSVERIHGGDPSELLAAGLVLHVYEGRVTHIFTQRFVSTFIGGPCLVIDCEIPHGMSGGPVLNDQGFAIGVASAGASQFFARPASIVSLLCPALLSVIDYAVQDGPVRVNRKEPLVELVCRGLVQTDGSEQRVPIGLSAEGPMVHFSIEPADQPFTHDDFHGYQEGRAAEHPTDRIAFVRRNSP